MHWQYSPYMLPLIVSAVVAIALAIIAWQRRSTPGAMPLSIMMSAATLWLLAYTLELGSVNLTAKVFWSNTTFVGIVIVPASWLAFALQYTGRGRWLTHRHMALLTIVPIITVLLAWTNGAHGLFRNSIALNTSHSPSTLTINYGLAFWLHATYSYLLLLLGTLLLLQAYIRSPRLYRGQTGTMLIGAVVPWIANALHIFGLNPIPDLDLTPFAFTLTGVAMAWGLFRFRLLDIVPVARNAIVEGMSDGVIVLDAQNRIVDFNPAAERIFDRAASEIIGEPGLQILTHPSGRPLYSQSTGLARILAEQPLNATEIQTELVHSQGNAQRYFDVRTSPLTHHNGAMAGRLVVLRDITELKQAEEAMALARDQALEASRLKTELLANVSHDLRTPLNAILGYADLLQNEAYGPLLNKQRQKTERIVANTKHLSSLVNDLLDQAQLEAGKLKLKRTSFSPANLAQYILSIMSAEAQAKGLTLTVEIADNLPDTLPGDRQRIRQVLLNLVSNAIKFTKQGAVQVLMYRSNETHWILQISDTGCGIPPEAQNYIFDPFRQVDGSPTREHDGVGLGLSLTKQLITLMNGEIALKSQVGQGSTFAVTLPLIPTEEEQS